MKKIARYFLIFLGLAALIYITGEPQTLGLGWLFGEIVAAGVLILAFKGAARLEK